MLCLLDYHKVDNNLLKILYSIILYYLYNQRVELLLNVKIIDIFESFTEIIESTLFLIELQNASFQSFIEVANFLLLC